MSRWLKEPLLHFLLLGAVIFFAYGAMSGDEREENEIYISRGQQENLINTFSRTWQRPPTPQEFQGLLKDLVRQEIAGREARAMGLDEGDIVIQRRLRQKVEMLAEDVAALVPPDDGQLQAYLDENPEQFLVEPRFTFSQVYFSVDRRGDQAEEDARAALGVLAGAGANGAPGTGDPLPLPERVEDAGQSEVARLFGNVFTDGLEGLETGRWSGPVRSGYGLHLVYIEDRAPARSPGLSEVRDNVERELMAQRRQQAVDGLYDRLAAAYTIDIEPLVDDGAAQRESP